MTRPNFKPRDDLFDQKVRQSFAKQHAMSAIGIELVELEPGRVVLAMPFNSDFTQQHGFIHGGIVTTGLDSACGYAALSLMDTEAAVLTVEFKTSLIAPAGGDRFIFEGQVIKSGRTLSFCEGKATAITGNDNVHIATMSATLMSIRDRPGIVE